MRIYSILEHINQILEDTKGVSLEDVFSDIEFNDKKSINCQARAVAIYVSITRTGKKEYYLSNFNHFIELYKNTMEGQISLFE